MVTKKSKNKEVDYYNIGGIIAGIAGLLTYPLPLGVLALYLGWYAKDGKFALWLGSICLTFWFLMIVLFSFGAGKFMWSW